MLELCRTNSHHTRSKYAELRNELLCTLILCFSLFACHSLTHSSLTHPHRAKNAIYTSKKSRKSHLLDVRCISLYVLHLYTYIYVFFAAQYSRTFGNNVAFVQWFTYNDIVGGTCLMRCFLRYEKLYVIGKFDFLFSWWFCHR